MATKFNRIEIDIPSGAKITADIPAELDGELVALALKGFLGGLYAITKCEDAEVRRTFLVRFVASAISEANAALHSTQMNTRIGDKSPQAIVEDLLKSLHSGKDK